jgi:hypothetical protein
LCETPAKALEVPSAVGKGRFSTGLLDWRALTVEDVDQAEADDVGAVFQGETNADAEDLGLLMSVQTDDVEEDDEEELASLSDGNTEVDVDVEVNFVKTLLLSVVRCMLNRLLRKFAK